MKGATTVRRLLELIRFSHTLFALPFALLSAMMAWTANRLDVPPVPFRWLDLVGIVLCMVFARAAAMAFNRLVDRAFDAANPRTRSRHLVTGQLSRAAVVGFTILCSVGFIASTLLFLPLNPIPLAASVPVLLFLFGYSYSKRYTSVAHFWLGVALMLAPVAAWVAVRGELAIAPVVLGSAVLFWVAGFDIIYACQDVDFDRTAGLRSIPARVGVARALRLAGACHLIMFGSLVALRFVFEPFGWLYDVGVALIGLLLAYEHWLVRPNDPSRVNRAFFHVNAVVSVGLAVIGAIDLFL